MCESHGFCGWSVGFWTCVCLTKSGESGKDCKGVAARKDKRERNLWLRCNTCKQFCIWSVQKLGASGVAVGEVQFCWRGALRMRRAAVFWTFCIGWITEDASGEISNTRLTCIWNPYFWSLVTGHWVTVCTVTTACSTEVSVVTLTTETTRSKHVRPKGTLIYLIWQDKTCEFSE